MTDDDLAWFTDLWKRISDAPGSRSGGMNFYVDEDGATVQETWEARTLCDG